MIHISVARYLLAFTMINSMFLFILAFTNFETQNRYQIKNSMGQQVYFAGEGKYYLFTFITTKC